MYKVPHYPSNISKEELREKFIKIQKKYKNNNNFIYLIIKFIIWLLENTSYYKLIRLNHIGLDNFINIK